MLYNVIHNMKAHNSIVFNLIILPPALTCLAFLATIQQVWLWA